MQVPFLPRRSASGRREAIYSDKCALRPVSRPKVAKYPSAGNKSENPVAFPQLCGQ
jgi:hypothetical protein